MSLSDAAPWLKHAQPENNLIPAGDKHVEEQSREVFRRMSITRGSEAKAGDVSGQEGRVRTDDPHSREPEAGSTGTRPQGGE